MELEEEAAAAGVTKDEWTHFTAYVSGFYSNLSNYHSFGKGKFAPDLTVEKFHAIIFSSPVFSQANSAAKDAINQLYPMVEAEIFALQKPYTSIGYPFEGGVSAYFGANLTE